MPPFPEPSSLVTTRPSSSMALLNSLACWRAFEPVVASTTMSLVCGAVSSCLPMVRSILASSSMRL